MAWGTNPFSEYGTPYGSPFSSRSIPSLNQTVPAKQGLTAAEILKNAVENPGYLNKLTFSNGLLHIEETTTSLKATTPYGRVLNELIQLNKANQEMAKAQLIRIQMGIHSGLIKEKQPLPDLMNLASKDPQEFEAFRNFVMETITFLRNITANRISAINAACQKDRHLISNLSNEKKEKEKFLAGFDQQLSQLENWKAEPEACIVVIIKTLQHPSFCNAEKLKQFLQEQKIAVISGNVAPPTFGMSPSTQFAPNSFSPVLPMPQTRWSPEDPISSFRLPPKSQRTERKEEEHFPSSFKLPMNSRTSGNKKPYSTPYGFSLGEEETSPPFQNNRKEFRTEDEETFPRRKDTTKNHRPQVSESNPEKEEFSFLNYPIKNMKKPPKTSWSGPLSTTPPFPGTFNSPSHPFSLRSSSSSDEEILGPSSSGFGSKKNEGLSPQTFDFMSRLKSSTTPTKPLKSGHSSPDLSEEESPSSVKGTSSLEDELFNGAIDFFTGEHFTYTAPPTPPKQVQEKLIIPPQDPVSKEPENTGVTFIELLKEINIPETTEKKDKHVMTFAGFKAAILAEDNNPVKQQFLKRFEMPASNLKKEVDEAKRYQKRLCDLLRDIRDKKLPADAPMIFLLSFIQCLPDPKYLRLHIKDALNHFLRGKESEKEKIVTALEKTDNGDTLLKVIAKLKDYYFAPASKPVTLEATIETLNQLLKVVTIPAKKSPASAISDQFGKLLEDLPDSDTEEPKEKPLKKTLSSPPAPLEKVEEKEAQKEKKVASPPPKKEPTKEYQEAFNVVKKTLASRETDINSILKDILDTMTKTFPNEYIPFKIKTNKRALCALMSEKDKDPHYQKYKGHQNSYLGIITFCIIDYPMSLNQKKLLLQHIKEITLPEEYTKNTGKTHVLEETRTNNSKEEKIGVLIEEILKRTE